MTKYDILCSLPYYIEHPSHGQGELEAYTTSDGYCAVQYRHADGGTSYGTWARTWKAVYADLRPYLKEQGHVEY